MDILSVPEVRSVRYQRNFIKTAVCELRFPTLLELETRPPTGFQAQMRKAYPFYEQQIAEVSGPEGVMHEPRYLFRSRDQRWTVSLRTSALSLETSKYTDFQEFSGRLKDLFEKSSDLVDSDFFTRVGLRYINIIPITDGQLEGWLNSELVNSVTSGVLGTVEKYVGLVQGYTEYGQYTFRHGIRSAETEEEKEKAGQEKKYFLDFDYFRENVESKDLLSLVESFNRINFSFFSWCLGQKAKDYLGKGTDK